MRANRGYGPKGFAYLEGPAGPARGFLGGDNEPRFVVAGAAAPDPISALGTE